MASSLAMVSLGIGGIVAVAGGETVHLAGRDFNVPAGFRLELAAGPDLVPRPIVGDFNQRGDLLVADSSGSNADVETQLRERPHRIMRLRDKDADGVYDVASVFAEQMMFPEGLLCHQGSVFVAAPPHIWRLTDEDDDGVADKREVWFDGETLTGCANDLHGPYLGRDGWIYWCKGAFAEQTYADKDGETWSTRAAHIFRRRLEGGVIEPVMTGGMDNPVDVAFSSAGERFFTTTFLQHPAGGRRDGVIHAIYGGVYGKQHGVLDGHPLTGRLMPVLSHLGPAAPSGLTCLDGDFLDGDLLEGPDDSYDGNLLSCAFNLHQVTRHVLTADGGTFRSVDSAWLSTPDLDFHPTDVVQDADGSVVVIDTGGWYKLCCPTSQLHKPDVLGGIYRLRRVGANVPSDPRGARLEWETAADVQLVERLDDPRHVVRQRAIETLALRNDVAWPSMIRCMESASSTRTRQNLVWAACRSDDAAARTVLLRGLKDSDVGVRQASLHAISVRRDQNTESSVIACLDASNEAVCRVAAEALGRIGTEAAIPHLLAQMERADDRVLEHSLIYALIEIANRPALESAWAEASPAARRGLLVALDQIPGGEIDVQRAVSCLDAADPQLRRTAMWAVARHEEWGPAVLDHLLKRMPDFVRQPERADELAELVGSFASQEGVQSSWAAALADSQSGVAARRWLLQILRLYASKELNTDLQRALAQTLDGRSTEQMPEWIGALAAHPRQIDDDSLIKVLQSIAQRDDLAGPLRLQAMGVLGGNETPLPDGLFESALQTAIDDPAFDMRRLATSALASARLTPAQLARLLTALPQADPVELGQLILVLKQTHDTGTARTALQYLAESSALVVVPDSLIREAFAHFDPQIQQSVAVLLKNRTDGQADAAGHLQQLLEELPSGDIRRGQQVFHSGKAACFTCHAMGYRGGEIGPDLTRIGRVRSRRDLLEAIVFPSLSFVRSFEPLSVTTKSGLTVQGVLKDENAHHLVLINDQRKQIEIARTDIEHAEPGRISVMPSGLDQLLTKDELADLLAFLEASR